MNNGLFGFFAGANITIDVQEFDRTDINLKWKKPQNAQLCFIEGTGGGQAGGGNGATAVNRVGGQAGVAYQILINASELNDEELVVIGAGGAGAGGAAVGISGGDTIFSGFYWSGGFNGASGGRFPFSGVAYTSGWGVGGATSTTLSGGHGGFGAGGGGRNGNSGGKPRSFQFSSGANLPERGGGAASPQSANPLNDRDGFGEGAGGGSGATPGGNGRRGSGGGGAGTTLGTNGGSGGDGFLRVITYCWE